MNLTDVYNAQLLTLLTSNTRTPFLNSPKPKFGSNARTDKERARSRLEAHTIKSRNFRKKRTRLALLQQARATTRKEWLMRRANSG